MRGLAFQPKGFRLAATHYNGATLWFPKVEGAPQILEWKGAHLDVTFSPDGRFLVTSMQENALHGWRLSDSRNMRMTGYPARRARSPGRMTANGWRPPAPTPRRLAVQGEGRADGQGRRANAACARRAMTQVAFHPKALVVAIGYADGLVLLCRLADAAEILVRPPRRRRGQRARLGRNRRTALFGLELGAAGLLALPA